LLIAAAGTIYLLRADTRAALCILLPGAAYYFVSLRTHDLIMLRYTLPMLVLGAVCAGGLCAAVATAWPRLGGAMVAALCALALARAVELDLLLRNDARYAAEQWLRAGLAPGSAVETYQKPVYLPRLRHLDAHFIPLAERSVDALLQRRPAAILTSSAAQKGITHRWNPDWRQGNTLLVEAPEATALMRQLERGELPYRRVAVFEQQPRLLRVRITSLCPKISVYRRVDE
jgi:hypothetical protein